MTITRIRITDRAAADIANHVRTYLRPGHQWSEVQVMRECDHGCKLYVRQADGADEYRLIHSSSYGCPLGRDGETREVPVDVEVAPIEKLCATVGDYVHVLRGGDHVQGYVNACAATDITLVDWSRWHMGSSIPAYGKSGHEIVLPLTDGTSVEHEDDSEL